jgi:hypothetical protein
LLGPLQSLSSTTAQRLVFLASCLNCHFGVDTLIILRNKIAGEQSVCFYPIFSIFCYFRSSLVEKFSPEIN